MHRKIRLCLCGLRRDKQFALQSGRHEECRKFIGRRHLAEEAHPRLPLFVFLPRHFLRPFVRYEERLSCILNSCLAVKWQHGTRTSPILAK